MEKNELFEQLKTICKDVFDADINELTKKDDIEAWDSLGHLKLMMQIEQTIGVKFKMEQIPELTSINDIIEATLERQK